MSAATAAKVGGKPYTFSAGAASSGPTGGLTPSLLADAYGYAPDVGGEGQTVAVIDAFDDPKIEGDLAEFDSFYGLGTCTEADGCFEKVGEPEGELPQEDTTGWSLETSLDVETVRAACRRCRILLVEARSSRFEDLAAAVDEAVALGASEVSNSYGGPEGELGALERAYDHEGAVITAATGDFGYDDWSSINEFESPPERPNVPASLPSVVAVGGTTLQLNEDGTRASESVWNGDGPGDLNEYVQDASGGGCSTLFTAPLWQRDAAGYSATGCETKRLEADVSAVADPFTGLDVYDSYECGSYCSKDGIGKGWVTVGGTSLATPLISSLYALAGGSHGVPYPALTLYGHLGDASDLYDVTDGANGFCDGLTVSSCGDPNAYFGRVDCEGTSACNARPGFDGPSGVGTPNGLGAFQPLLPGAAIAPPTTLKVGVPAAFSAAGSSDPYPGGYPSIYTWSWGDGTSGARGMSPEHTFSAPGSYEVTLDVTDNYGLTSEPATATVHVVERTTNELEEEAAAKKRQEEEAAVKKRGEEEAALASRKAEELVAVGSASHGTAAFKVHVAAAVPDVRLASSILDVSSAGTVKVRVGCPARESRCIGTLSLRTLSAMRIAGSQSKSVLVLASGSFSIPGGGVGVVTLHLSPAARRLLARSRGLRVRASLRAHDPASAVYAGQEIVQLRLPGMHRG